MEEEKQDIRKSMNINLFNSGDLIQRVKPAMIKGYREDCSLSGKDIVCVYEGIVEGKIHVLNKGGAWLVGKRVDQLYKLDYEDWKDGWARYVNPKILELSSKDNILNKEDAQGFLEGVVKNYSN